MFKFKGISSNDMQVIVEEEEEFIARAAHKYEQIDVDGRDGAEFNELGYSVVERPIRVQCLNVDKVDEILAWLNGEGEFEYKGRKTIARFYSELEPKRSSWIRIIDTTFIRDPFWYKANEEYLLVKDDKKKNVSGESIHIEDSSDARCELEIGGNQQQEIREGYNLLDLSNFSTQTKNGVTATKNEDGSIKLVGTNSGDTFNINLSTINGKIGDYIASGVMGGSRETYFLAIVQSGVKTFTEVTNGSSNFSLTEETTIAANIYIVKGAIINTTIYPMMIKGTENKPYEQYGASPSFAYPSSVKAVGDVKNILNMSNAKGGTSGGITCNMIADGSYTYKGTASSKTINIWLLGSYNNKNSIFRLEPGTYYIDGVVLFDGNNVLANTGTAKIFTFINAHDITGVRVLDAVLENTYDETKYPIIAEIDHEIPWVPYEMGYIKVNEFNKNYLSKIPKKSITTQGITSTFDGEKFICKGTAMYNYFNLVTQRIQQHFKAGTYTFSSNMFAKGRACIRFYYEDGTADTYYSNINTRKISFTLKKDAYAYFLMVDGLTVGGGDVLDCIIKLQLEDGNTSTEIVKAENQEFVVDVQQPMFENDTFMKQDAKWYEKHNWKTMSFDGQNMGSQAGGTFADFKENGNIVRTFEIKDLLISSVRNDIFCDKLPRQADSMWNGKSTGIQSWQGQNKILISLPFDDVEKKYGQKLTVDNYVTAFYMYLQDEVLIISYPLAEPKLLECTETQSKELDEIYNKIHTYKNITNILAESAEVNPIINVEYLVETNEKIINDGNYISSPILRLEKTKYNDVELTINDTRFKYHFEQDKYVEIDCEQKSVKCDGVDRYRQIEIDYKFPKLNLKENNIIMHLGDCKIKVLRKDRWL